MAELVELKNVFFIATSHPTLRIDWMPNRIHVLYRSSYPLYIFVNLSCSSLELLFPRDKYPFLLRLYLNF